MKNTKTSRGSLVAARDPREKFRTAVTGYWRRVTIPLRWAVYVEQAGWAMTVRRLLPKSLQKRLGLDADDAVGSRRIELGGGIYPLAGYIHVDGDWRGHHLEAVAPADSLPFETDFADELLTIHLLEHVHPTGVAGTLTEWLRVLRPGGRLEVHVPDFEALAAAYLRAEGADRWQLTGAILGMHAFQASGPQDVAGDPDHRLLPTWGLLSSELRAAGFDDISNVSDEVRDRHSDGWVSLVPQISLVVRASKPFDRRQRDGRDEAFTAPD